MRRGWRVGGLFLMLLVPALPASARAEAPAGSKAEDEAVQKAREQIQEELKQRKPDYEDIEKSLNVLLKKAREHEAGTTLPTEPPTASDEADLRSKMAEAVEGHHYDLAAYYMDRLHILAEKPNPFGGWLDLTIWTIVVFLLLLFVLGRYAWKPMLQGLQKRENDIQAAIQDARAAREEATRLRQEVQAERDKIEAMRRDIIQRAEADAQRRADEVTATAEAKMKSEHDRMMRELETKGDQLWQELIARVSDLAATISTKAIRRSLTPEDHRRFVDESLAELRQAGNGQKTSASA